MTSIPTDIFHRGEQLAQKRWHTEKTWGPDRKLQLLWNHIPSQYHQRLESAPFFFVATSNLEGHCDCSFKGGGPDIVKIINEKQMAFADFDGNGAFMTLGNIIDNPNIGCLFIDFNDGARLRVNGKAEVFDQNTEYGQLFPSHPRTVVVDIELVVPNCAAYIPKLQFSTD